MENWKWAFPSVVRFLFFLYIFSFYLFFPVAAVNEMVVKQTERGWVNPIQFCSPPFYFLVFLFSPCYFFSLLHLKHCYRTAPIVLAFALLLSRGNNVPPPPSSSLPSYPLRRTKQGCFLFYFLERIRILFIILGCVKWYEWSKRIWKSHGIIEDNKYANRFIGSWR